jgi:hypothetical protein
MVQRGHNLRFAMEARDPLRVVGKEVGQHLDRDFAPQFSIARAIHLAHAACTNQGLDLVGTQ